VAIPAASQPAYPASSRRSLIAASSTITASGVSTADSSARELRAYRRSW
jgi:hypothetical protein